jgi:hypothetical protein
MARNLVPPARMGWLRSLLVALEADLWGPDWLWDWITEGDPKLALFVSVSRSLGQEPKSWSISPYGVTNHEDGIGVYCAEGRNSVAVAVDGDRQYYPSSYYRRLLWDAVAEHRRTMAAEEAFETAGRLAPSLH